MKRYILLIIFVFCFTVENVMNQIPQTISYQGILTDDSGNPVTNGNYNLTFKLYEGLSAGTEIWTETKSVTTTNGLFNSILGSVTPLTLDFDKPYWLGITIDGGTELIPRIELTSSPYSLNARSIADSIVIGKKIADDHVVRSINSLTDDIILIEGANVTITPSGNTITISAVGGNDDGDWTISGNDLYSTVSGNVGIGTNNPERKLHIANSDYVSLILEDKGAFANEKKKFINSDDGLLRFGYFTDSWTMKSQLELNSMGVTRIVKDDYGLTILPQNNNTVGLGFTSGSQSWYNLYISNDHSSFNNDVYIMGGKLGLNVSSPTHMIEVQQNSYYADPIADAWTVYSSRRWKTKINPIENALEKVLQLTGVSFTWKSNGKKDIGLIAEDVGKIIPEVVVYEQDGEHAKSVDYARLVSLLIEAIKEQQKQIELLKQENLSY